MVPKSEKTAMGHRNFRIVIEKIKKLLINGYDFFRYIDIRKRNFEEY